MIRLSEELSDLDLGDARLNRRACTLIERLARHPEKSIPAACGGWHETKAAYRLFDSEMVTAQALLEPHRECTLERMMTHPTVLCICRIPPRSTTPARTTSRALAASTTKTAADSICIQPWR